MKVVCIIQARLASTRLPRKVLADICGWPMLTHVISRARAIPGVDQIVLTMPKTDRGETVGFPWFGTLAIAHHDPPDVLRGYARAAQQTGADIIVRLTGDCPLIAPEVCEEVLHEVAHGGSIYATNDTRVSGFPDGLDCQAFTRELLEWADRYARAPADREHVCPWMERVCAAFYEGELTNTPIYAPSTIVRAEEPDVCWPKLSVDTQEELERVRRVMAGIPAGEYSWKATREVIRAEFPEIG